MSTYISDQIKARPLEARKLRRIYRACAENGTPVTSLYDGEESTDVLSIDHFVELAFNLDEFTAYCRDLDSEGQDLSPSLFIVMGEDPDDMLADYDMSLDTTLYNV